MFKPMWAEFISVLFGMWPPGYPPFPITIITARPKSRLMFALALITPQKFTLRRCQKWPSLKGVTFSKPSFWVSMLVFGGCKSWFLSSVGFHHLFLQDFNPGSPPKKKTKSFRIKCCLYWHKLGKAWTLSHTGAKRYQKIVDSTILDFLKNTSKK